MRIIVTGAAGYIGGKLVTRLLAEDRYRDARFTLFDAAPCTVDDPRVLILTGDIRDPATRATLLQGGGDIVFHLAGILGGAAEADYPLARSVNIDATLSLLEALRRENAPPRIVFASTVAVFGAPMPAAVDDLTIPLPTMSYGAQKLVAETIIGQFSRRGWIDGIALRLPGIVARPDADARLKSAYLNHVFHDFAAGRAIMLPVSPDATTWLVSVESVIDALIHAAALPPDRLGEERSLNLPAQRVAMDALVAALGRRFPDSASIVTYAPDPYLDAQFGSYPPLETALGDALGFRHDGSLANLVERALQG